MPTFLKGYEDPGSRPARGPLYAEMMDAYVRLVNARAPRTPISMQALASYYRETDAGLSFPWFVDAVQMIERVAHELHAHQSTDAHG